jgi:hypothetical protein
MIPSSFQPAGMVSVAGDRRKSTTWNGRPAHKYPLRSRTVSLMYVTFVDSTMRWDRINGAPAVGLFHVVSG